MSFRLVVPRELYEAMLRQAREELPNECCGFLAGIIAGGAGRVTKRYPLVNRLASPKEYEVRAGEVRAALDDMDRLGIEALALYHSHPTSAPVPSKKDLESAFYEEAVYLIVSLVAAEPEVRGWWLTETDYREAAWEVAG